MLYNRLLEMVRRSRSSPALGCRVAAILQLTALLPGAALAEDWPQWRGLERNGVWSEDGILERFPDGGLEVSWRAPVRSGFAGPAVADGRVFVLDWQKDRDTSRMAGTERLVALDETSGEVLWSQEWPASYASIQASYAIGPRATPTVDGKRVFVVGAVGQLLALDVETGKRLWGHDYVEEYGTTVPVWGISSAPLVDGDLLICLTGAEGRGGQPDGKVIAYDKATGDEVWRALSSDWEMGYAQPVIVDAGGARQLIIWHPQAVSSLDPQTGRVLWEVPWDVGMGMTVATPVADRSQLFLSQFYKGSLMVELAPGRALGSLRWKGGSNSEFPDETEGLHSMITTPILDGETIYGVGSYGEFRALDAETGERLWVDDTLVRQGRWGTAFMVRQQNVGQQPRYFMNNDGGELIILRLGRSGPEVLDRTQLIEPTSQAGYGPRRWQDAIVNWTHPAYANRHIVTRNDREVLRISLAPGD